MPRSVRRLRKPGRTLPPEMIELLGSEHPFIVAGVLRTILPEGGNHFSRPDLDEEILRLGTGIGAIMSWRGRIPPDGAQGRFDPRPSGTNLQIVATPVLEYLCARFESSSSSRSRLLRELVVGDFVAMLLDIVYYLPDEEVRILVWRILTGAVNASPKLFSRRLRRAIESTAEAHLKIGEPLIGQAVPRSAALLRLLSAVGCRSLEVFKFAFKCLSCWQDLDESALWHASLNYVCGKRSAVLVVRPELVLIRAKMQMLLRLGDLLVGSRERREGMLMLLNLEIEKIDEGVGARSRSKAA